MPNDAQGAYQAVHIIFAPRGEYRRRKLFDMAELSDSLVAEADLSREASFRNFATPVKQEKQQRSRITTAELTRPANRRDVFTSTILHAPSSPSRC